MSSLDVDLTTVRSESFEDCYARFDGERLTIGNERIERRWRVRDGLLHAESILDRLTGKEWVTQASKCPAPYPPIAYMEQSRDVDFVASSGAHGPVEGPSLQVDLRVRGDAFSGTFRFKIFPGVSAIASQLMVDGSFDAMQHPEFKPPKPPSGIESNNVAADAGPSPDVMDAFEMDPLHVDLTQVILKDQSDVHDNLVFENRWMLHSAEQQIRLAGNLFILKNRLTGNGLIVLKQGPQPHARPVKNAVDLELRGSALRTYGHGFDASGGSGYPSVTLLFSGSPKDCGFTSALHAYQRALRPHDPNRDGLLMSSTWGDRNKDAKIGEQFLIDEVRAGKKLGIDMLAIDAGWEKRAPGSPAGSSVWSGYWKMAEDYWTPDPKRFPRGLEPVVEEAKRLGVKLGLWYVADATDDYANWERDAAHILELRRRYNVDHFKLDGVKFFTRLGEARLAQLYQTLLRESDGAISIDQDITANVRPGYFGQIDAGPLFVENRYTDWHRYWPHATLRTVWQLSQYVHPPRLRMEFLNNHRNADVYGDADPLAPHRYSSDYLFASVMLTSPLGWFEASCLDEAFIASVSPLVEKWKRRRDRLFTGDITPIGQSPDGTSWTGFAVTHDAGADLIVFRELNDRPAFEFDVPMLDGREISATLVHGDGSARVKNGIAAVEIAEPLRFGWFELRAK